MDGEGAGCGRGASAPQKYAALGWYPAADWQSAVNSDILLCKHARSIVNPLRRLRDDE